MRNAIVALALGGCLYQHDVELDRESVDVARGLTQEIVISVDGAPVEHLDYVLWSVADPAVASVVPSWDDKRLRIGGDLEGETTVRVNVHGLSFEVPTRVGPPALVRTWIEPDVITTNVGADVPLKALALDSLAHVRDITRDSEWTVRDPGVARLDMAGMMLCAETEGRTTLHVATGGQVAVVPITILK